MDALVVTTADHRLTGEAAAAAVDVRSRPRLDRRGRGDGRHDERRASSTISPGWPTSRPGSGRGFTWTARTAVPGCSRRACRDKFAGIERADSFVVDPHKWLFAPFDCAALLYREPALARSVHTQDASYLDVIHDKPGEWNPTDYAYHLTRRARGLPLWFSMSVHGVRAYSDAIEAAISLARETAAEIAGRDYLELIMQPDLSVVLFRRRGWAHEQYARWAQELLDEQIAFIPPSAWEGETVARFAFLHPHTSMDLVGSILDRMA